MDKPPPQASSRSLGADAALREEKLLAALGATDVIGALESEDGAQATFLPDATDSLAEVEPPDLSSHNLGEFQLLRRRFDGDGLWLDAPDRPMKRGKKKKPHGTGQCHEARGVGERPRVSRERPVGPAGCHEPC